MTKRIQQLQAGTALCPRASPALIENTLESRKRSREQALDGDENGLDEDEPDARRDLSQVFEAVSASRTATDTVNNQPAWRNLTPQAHELVASKNLRALSAVQLLVYAAVSLAFFVEVPLLMIIYSLLTTFARSICMRQSLSCAICSSRPWTRQIMLCRKVSRCVQPHKARQRSDIVQSNVKSFTAAVMYSSHIPSYKANVADMVMVILHFIAGR